MEYTAFENYPLQILGINESYNSELTAIEDFIISDMQYSGVAYDIVSILPYFVYHAFCITRRSQVTALNGETAHVAESTLPSTDQQKDNWNIGVEKLYAICSLNATDVKKDYKFILTIFGPVRLW